MRNNPFSDFTVSELSGIIGETIFDKESDREIALDVFVKSMTVEKCASIVMLDWKTVQKRLPRIKDRINVTILRLKQQ